MTMTPHRHPARLAHADLPPARSATLADYAVARARLERLAATGWAVAARDLALSESLARRGEVMAAYALVRGRLRREAAPRGV